MITFIRATLRGASRRPAAAAASAAANGGGGRAGPGLGFRARPPNGRAACAIGSLGDRRRENWWKWVLCFLFGASLWYEERGKKEGEAEKGLLLRAHLAASVSGNTQSTRRGLPTSEPTGGWVPPRVGPGCHCVVAPARRRWARVVVWEVRGPTFPVRAVGPTSGVVWPDQFWQGGGAHRAVYDGRSDGWRLILGGDASEGYRSPKASPLLLTDLTAGLHARRCVLSWSHGEDFSCVRPLFLSEKLDENLDIRRMFFKLLNTIFVLGYKTF